MGVLAFMISPGTACQVPSRRLAVAESSFGRGKYWNRAFDDQSSSCPQCIVSTRIEISEEVPSASRCPLFRRKRVLLSSRRTSA